MEKCVFNPEFKHWCQKHGAKKCSWGGESHCVMKEIPAGNRRYIIEKGQPVLVKPDGINCYWCRGFDSRDTEAWRQWVERRLRLVAEPGETWEFVKNRMADRVEEWANGLADTVGIRTFLLSTGLWAHDV